MPQGIAQTDHAVHGDMPPAPVRPRRVVPLRRPPWRRLRRAMPVEAAGAIVVLGLAAWLAGFASVAAGLLAVGAVAMAARVLTLWLDRAARVPPETVVSLSQAGRLAGDVLDRAAGARHQTAALLLRLEGMELDQPGWDDRGPEHAMATVVRRIGAVLRQNDAVFRMSEDRVAVLLDPVPRMDLDIAMNVADRIQAAVAEPLSVDGRILRLQSRIGICTQGMSPQPRGAALIAAAACALREATRQEEGAVRAFTPELRRETETGHRLQQRVGEAIANGEVGPWFQPQVDAADGTIVGFEALARWDHPDLGLLAPGQFLPAVAAAGRGTALGERMLRGALEALEAWDRAGLAVPRVGVNFSLAELRDPRLAERVVWEIDRAGIAPDRIAVEILETVALDDAEETIIRNVRALGEAGLRLDLDDFGTGSASISHIARFGVDRIKIDRSFVAALPDDDAARRVIAAILGLAADLGIETIAEGVETDAQAEALAGMGCTHLQGFGIGRPMPFADTLAWLRGRQPVVADLSAMRPRGTA